MVIVYTFIGVRYMVRGIAHFSKAAAKTLVNAVRHIDHVEIDLSR